MAPPTKTASTPIAPSSAAAIIAGDAGVNARGRATDEGRDARGRATQGAVADEGRDARGRATQGAVAEHIYIGSDELGADPATAARTPGGTVILRNAIRRTGAELTFYDEGYLKVIELANGQADAPFMLDLRFVDPVPKIERVIAMRWLTAAFGCGALAVLAAFLLRFDAFYTVAVWLLGVAGIATAGTLYVGIYSSHEKIQFCTLHGRAAVLELVANLGSIKKFHAFVPKLCRAIDEAADRIGTDTAAYLRAEMREHYRLRGDGVLENDECARGTGRILAQFDVQL